ncbi:MAG: hypothetical protein UV78_C0073G0004 [Parcubacteria group bacterium GW2011_GWA2_43_17]|nr:MAG: hypothetical protein UV78_C0073G0004 [Parcubacteria group bacterium GW2011_GWA2_43_17]KKT94386.1 MAG: hypothetical protein UW91_C0002G0030 [Parcubacteria group bacterium GW2011_GWF2_45_11]KKT98693.1 MAG: hypothetical protein UW98_C0005G0013 [Parcubacteria group bacterium GW2011_GWC2_45_15]OGY93638.1 MAG: hypothetical protein A2260_03170 [Candidatus Komeilibacteria bacterium RIFOXYA2_FULL_45_9]OGY94593.1 MAG: hypothetical protein A3J95_04040 [Candidatus Komeilibacteria bacterium RIFOXYC2
MASPGSDQDRLEKILKELTNNIKPLTERVFQAEVMAGLIRRYGSLGSILKFESVFQIGTSGMKSWIWLRELSHEKIRITVLSPGSFSFCDLTIEKNGQIISRGRPASDNKKIMAQSILMRLLGKHQKLAK